MVSGTSFRGVDDTVKRGGLTGAIKVLVISFHEPIFSGWNGDHLAAYIDLAMNSSCSHRPYDVMSFALDVLRHLIGSIRCVAEAPMVRIGKGYLVGHFERGSRPFPLLDVIGINSCKDAICLVAAGAYFQ